MAIAFDNVLNTTSSGSSSFSTSYTTSGSNRVLLAFFWTTQVPSTVTYNSVSMTQVRSFSAFGQTNYLYILTNPASGANTFAITWGANATIALGIASYNGCAQSGQPDNSNSNSSGSGSTDSNTLSSVADNCWHIGGFANDATSNVTAGAGTTKRSPGGSDYNIFDNNAAITPAGSNTLNVNISGGATNKGNSSVTLVPFTATAQSEFLSFF